MKRNKLLLLLSILMVVAFASPSMAAHTLKTIGTHPFYKPPLRSVDDLRSMVQKRGPQIKEGFAKAGYADLYPAFVEQFPNAQIEHVQIQPGQTMEWMMFRRLGKGPVAVAKNLVWGAKAPFDAFQFVIQKDGNNYNMIVPWGCGNIALMDVAAAPEVPCPPPVAVAPTPAPVAPPPAPKGNGGPFVILGYEHQVADGKYIFGKVGYDFDITDRFHLLPSFDLYGHVGGDDGETSVSLDLLASYYVVPDTFALGIGVGFWPGQLLTRDQYNKRHDYGDDNNFDLILAAYYNLPMKWFGAQPAIYVEGREDFERFNGDWNKTIRYGGGLMVRF